MKGTDHFKRTIQMYLEQRAEEDTLFAKNYRNPAKNIDDCVTYILNYVQKSGCNGFTDGKSRSTSAGSPQIPRGGTPQVAEPHQADKGENRNPSSTLII